MMTSAPSLGMSHKVSIDVPSAQILDVHGKLITSLKIPSGQVTQTSLLMSGVYSLHVEGMVPGRFKVVR